MKAEANYQTEEVADPMASPVAVAGDDTTAQLTRIWQELLGFEPIEAVQNYFDLGGDSILAVQLFAHIQKVFQVKMPVATLFEAPTIEELARILRRETAPAFFLCSWCWRERFDLSRSFSPSGFGSAILRLAVSGLGWKLPAAI